VNIRKTGLRNDLASHFYTDASDFLERFDILYEVYSKTKRFKCFIDLLMGFECILKSHIFLSHKSSNMVEVYKEAKGAGHDLNKLADIARFLNDDIYQEIKDELGQYSVFIRYSLDAYENFLPSCIEYERGKYNYSATMTNHSWMMKMRNLLETLIQSTSSEFNGFIELDFVKLFDDSEKMRSFAIQVGVVKL
jgi:hypothetical protein